jgi:hypothetical protein
MRYIFRSFLALALIASSIAYADPPGRVGRLNYTSGAVSFAAADAPGQWTEAILNRPLTSGDRLWADRDSRAELHVGSTAVRLAPQTSLDVLHLDDDRLQLRLAQGSAALRVRELDADDSIEIATPGGTVVVRQPGSYRLGIDQQSGTTRVSANSGELELVTPAQRFVIPSGQVAVVSASGESAFEVATAASDEFDRWSHERDRRHEGISSTRYVSSHMTGYEDLDRHGSWRVVPEYGSVWVPTRVAPGWAPYRHGRWTWINPWGWTWVDDAPWGFAPFHYGRWVWLDSHWAWAPGPLVRRPVYAPALVAFIGGSHWSAGVGPAVGWFPLGWREPFHPWYRASHRHIHHVNVAHVGNSTNVHHFNHRHRHRPEAITVVPRESFVTAGHAARSRVQVAQMDLARAEVLRDRLPAQPVRASIAPQSSEGTHRGYGPGARRERELANRSEPLPGRVQSLPAHTERGGRRFDPAAGIAPQRSVAQQPAASQPSRAAAASIAAPVAPVPAMRAPISPVAQPQHGDDGHRGRGPGARRERELANPSRPTAPAAQPAPPAAQPRLGDEGHRGRGPGARRERELANKSGR